MLLRSSSTPVLGSLLLPSFSESPNHQPGKPTPNPIHGKIPTTHNGGRPPQSFVKPIFRSPSPAETKTAAAGFRRVQSEGNLKELANAAQIVVDEFTISNPKKPARIGALEAIPSFSFYNLGIPSQDDDDDESDDDEEFDFEFEDDYGSLRFEDGGGKMYLATGLGVSGVSFTDGGSAGGGGGGGNYRAVQFDRDGGDISMEEYFKKMLEENPGNALFLSNYAKFLYQKKRDLKKAEEYYSRAILADSNDGEVLAQYAKLIWELRRDKERATNYFQRAVQSSSEDSYVHAAYASFLWETEEDNDEEEDCVAENFRVGRQIFRQGSMASASA